MAFLVLYLKINILTQGDYSTSENLEKYAEYFLRNHKIGSDSFL